MGRGYRNFEVLVRKVYTALKRLFVEIQTIQAFLEKTQKREGRLYRKLLL